MSAPDSKRARQWLEAQIVELGALRNASTRDSGFKQWRQHTLTLIQRIWVGDSTKASRFKRIPFTTPGAKADRDQVRNAYEKGCGEALSCLRQLLDEIEERPPRLQSEGPHEPSPLDLNRIIEPDADAGSRHGAPKLPISRKPGIRPAAESDSSHPSELDLREARNLPASDRSQHAPEEEIPPPPPRRQAQEPPRRQAEEPPRRQAEEPPRRQAEEPTRRPAEEPPRRHTEDVKRRMQEMLRGQADTSRRPIGEPPRHPAEQPARRSADEPAKRSDEPGEHEVVRRAMADFLDSSPVFAAMDRMEREPGDEPRLSPSAFALAALASELADLGVEASERGRVRDALNEMAKHIDRRDLTWDELRDAVGIVMEFRGVARRVLPLLLPFLDEAA